jgi:hypothetical protein
MNGRVYDPLVGRFLSPDPFVQDISNSQSHKRYSYCLNNPVEYTDLTGEFFWIPIVIGAVMGGVMGAVQADMNGKPWHQGLIWGALIGGATGYLAGFAPTHWVGSTLYGAGLIAASGGGMAYVTGGNVKLAMITGAIVVSAMGIAYSEQCGNWTKGKGFQSNDNV